MVENLKFVYQNFQMTSHKSLHENANNVGEITLNTLPSQIAEIS